MCDLEALYEVLEVEHFHCVVDACVCVRERDRERQRERVCEGGGVGKQRRMCACVCECVTVCMYIPASCFNKRRTRRRSRGGT